MVVDGNGVVVNESDGVIVTGTLPVGGATFLEGFSPSSDWLMHAVKLEAGYRVKRVIQQEETEEEWYAG